ncbi:DnaJ-like protein subfamily C member 22 [Armadillidium nasatum]|uniref:DnaJ-like protein subfamily C member 22 n=1 Tax=Armadillidium nasatum TaxID=96803 RepID=A0A5N5TEH2_9CRUS|nr:DnaJ-like protein subfamily C member 22 [Armadillidium nasatum]
MAKSIIIAYILLIFGGFAGLHLLYLRRDKQAFLYWCTFGGYFGLAPLRDFFRLSSYVKEANNDSQYVADLAQQMRKNKKPPLNVTRFVAKILIGNAWCYLFIAAVPDEKIYGFSLHYLKYLGPFASALAVWLVGNIGRVKGSFKWCLYGAYSILPLTINNFHAINWSCVASAAFYEWKGKEWRRTPLPKHDFFAALGFMNVEQHSNNIHLAVVNSWLWVCGNETDQLGWAMY